jgi:hypothetical protein
MINVIDIGKGLLNHLNASKENSVLNDSINMSGTNDQKFRPSTYILNSSMNQGRQSPGKNYNVPKEPYQPKPQNNSA